MTNSKRGRSELVQSLKGERKRVDLRQTMTASRKPVVGSGIWPKLVPPGTIGAMQHALQAAAVEFLPEDGVRMKARKPRRPKTDEARRCEGEPRCRQNRRSLPKQSTPVDIHIGSRLRQRRTELGISQPNLAASLGLTFQQLYKYEDGTNRISASRLYEVSRAMDVPITFFFEGIAETEAMAQRPKRTKAGQR